MRLKTLRPLLCALLLLSDCASASAQPAPPSARLRPVQQGGKWGYVDAGGRFVIGPQFDDAHSFSEGLAAVLVGERWGYIDHTGAVVIKPKFGFGYDGGRHDFSEGLALVYRDDG